MRGSVRRFTALFAVPRRRRTATAISSRVRMQPGWATLDNVSLLVRTCTAPCWLLRSRATRCAAPLTDGYGGRASMSHALLCAAMRCAPLRVCNS